MTKDPDVAREITYDTMLRNCDGLLDWARRHNYDPRRNASDSHGVTLRHDPYVGFYRSTYEGKPCYYLTWSGYEHVWTPKERNSHGH